MRRFFLTLLMIGMLIITMNAASATTVSHVYWTANPANDLLTITDGETASFTWKAQTAYYDLKVKIGLYQGTTLITDYPVTCTSNTCNGYGTITKNNYAAPGTYTLRIDTRDALSACCGTADDDQITLIVKEAPPIDNDFTSITVNAIPSSGVAPLTTQLSCVAVGGDAPISYAWSFGDGTTSVVQHPVHTYQSPGSYTARCTATDVDGDTISGSVVVTVTAVPVLQPPVASFTWSPSGPYEKEQVSFIDQSYDSDGVIVSYSWSFGDGMTSSSRNPAHVFAVPGSYVVSLTVTDNDGLQDTEQHTVCVKKKDHDITDIIVTATPQSGQEPLDVIFTCTVVGGDAPLSYYWTFGDGASSSTQNPSHTYVNKGVYTAACTATDADGDTMTGTVTITVTEHYNPIIVDEFGCNPDVVKGHEEYCSIHVTDKHGNDLPGAKVIFTYVDPSFVDGVRFGSCTTNFKGYCSDDPIVNYPPGYYTVEATVSLIGYVPPEPVNDTFLVWAKRYEIIDLEVFGDNSFSIPQTTFYRGEDLYASFAIYDLITERFICDSGLVQEMFLRVNNEQPLHLNKVTDATWRGSRVQQGLFNWFTGLLGNGVQCTYQYWLPSIPLTDDYLGDGKVFAFTFNFSDDTAGQASKEVVVLNNEVTLNVPDATIVKYVASDSSSITIDLKEHVSDVETLPADMLYTMTTTQAVPITDNGNGVFTITAIPHWVADIIITATADDTDGSVATDTATIRITVQFIPQLPVAIAGPDQWVIEHTVVVVDGSASYDPDGGDIVSYQWDFGNGRTASGSAASTTYTAPGTYVVSLTVTDDEGDQDTDALLVTVGRQPFVPQCSDGIDNDGDGLIDMDDPNCDSPADNSEYGPVTGGLEKGLSVLSVSTYGFWGYERAVADDVVTVEVVLENRAGASLDGLRVGFSIPELGVKQKSRQFAIKDGGRETVVMEVYVPYDALPGEYYTQITVANDDLRRSLHRMITVVEG